MEKVETNEGTTILPDEVDDPVGKTDEKVEGPAGIVLEGAVCEGAMSRPCIDARIPGKQSDKARDIAWANASPLKVGPTGCATEEIAAASLGGAVSCDPVVGKDGAESGNMAEARLLFVDRAIKQRQLIKK